MNVPPGCSNDLERKPNRLGDDRWRNIVEGLLLYIAPP
jgi:hypothetical protein